MIHGRYGMKRRSRTTAARPRNLIGTPVLPTTSMIYAIRTRPVAGFSDFKTLAVRLTRLMACWGLQARPKSGSISWIKRTNGTYETVFKLIHVGSGEMILGINKAAVQKNAKLRDLPWPKSFSVAPQNQVEFVGFSVSNDDASLAKARDVLNGLGMPHGVSSLPSDSRRAEREFAERLSRISDAGVIVDSLTAAAASLPAEDFSDWER